MLSGIANIVIFFLGMYNMLDEDMTMLCNGGILLGPIIGVVIFYYKRRNVRTRQCMAIVTNDLEQIDRCLQFYDSDNPLCLAFALASTPDILQDFDQIEAALNIIDSPSFRFWLEFDQIGMNFILLNISQ